MNRSVLFLALMLATGFVLADDAPDAGDAAGEAQAQAAEGEGAAEDESATRAERDSGAGEPKAEAAEAKAAVNTDDTPEAEGAVDAGEAQGRSEEDAKLIEGMSILGNQEAPKSLVIVPWKSSEIGDSIGISANLDDSRQPIDKEVFMRALSYYQIRSGRK